MIDQPNSRRFSHDESAAFTPLYLAIGKLTRHWSAFEYVLNDTIWELANVERYAGTCITSQMIGPGPRFRCIIALLHMRGVSAALVKEFNTFSTEAESLGRQRNRFLHDTVVLDDNDQKLYRLEITADRRLFHDLVIIDFPALEKLVVDIENATGRIDTLFDRVISETPPWPRAQYEKSQGLHRDRNRQRDQPGSL
ncbi:hypothetical protein [Tardiphaga sp. P5_C10]